MTGKRILVVDDEPKMRRVLEMMLQKMGHEVVSAGNGVEALQCIEKGAVDLVITDLRMPEMDGIELLTELRARETLTPVIVITAYGTIESAVDAMKRGACDYILRPFDIDTLELAVGRVFATEELARENSFLRQEVNKGWNDFVGGSSSMQKVYELIQQIAPTRSAVLITGETGTGKELAARAVHQASPRRDKLFVPINCAAIPAEILESELFGYEKGAFTGATRERIGKFELANEGTVFLDELTEMPVALQAKLLRVLQRVQCRATWRQPRHSAGYPHRDGDQPQSPRGDPRRPLARGLVLSHQRLFHRTAAAAHASGGHPRAGHALHRQALGS